MTRKVISTLLVLILSCDSQLKILLLSQNSKQDNIKTNLGILYNSKYEIIIYAARLSKIKSVKRSQSLDLAETQARFATNDEVLKMSFI